MEYKQTTVAEDMKSAIWARKALGGKVTPADTNAIIARSTLHGELGYLDDGTPTIYNLDEATRDRLIAHARQDASHALLNTISLLKAMQDGKWTPRLLLVCIALLIYIAYCVSR